MRRNIDTSGPSVTKRVVNFVIGAVIGGFIGYGLITTSPALELSMFEFPGAAWVLGGAGIVGALAALFPDKVWRRRRSFDISHLDR